MSLFVIDIGNTNTGYGIWKDGAFRNVGSIPTSGLADLDIPSGMPVAGASVVPHAEKSIRRKDVFWLSHSASCGIDFAGADVSNLGADRLANLVAAADTGRLPAIIADFGTAITVDFLDRRRVFRGGLILPGRAISRSSLSRMTAKIPKIPMLGGTSVFGRNTAEAASFGIDNMLAEGVRGIIRKMLAQGGYAKRQCRLVAAGGDAAFFLERIPGLTFGGDEFTLLGIARAWEMRRR